MTRVWVSGMLVNFSKIHVCAFLVVAAIHRRPSLCKSINGCSGLSGGCVAKSHDCMCPRPYSEVDRTKVRYKWRRRPGEQCEVRSWRVVRCRRPVVTRFLI